MWKYIIKRVLAAIPVLLGIITIVFVVLRVFSPDPAALMLGERATAQKIADLREYLGLEQPLIVQYGLFIKQAVTGDLGKSLMSNLPVVPEIMKRLPATIELGLISLFTSSIFGMIIGVLSAVKHNRIFDRVSMIGGLVGISIPGFWLSLMMIILFGVNLSWLPISGRLPMNIQLKPITGLNILDSLLTWNMPALKETLRHLVMPGIFSGIIGSAGFARLTRTTMLEVVRQDYIRTARSKGLREATVIMKHALKNAAIPLVTSLGMALGGVVSGSVIAESIFSWPGVGSYLVNGIGNSDYAVVQAGSLILAASFVFVNLLVDILYGYLDPRIRY